MKAMLIKKYGGPDIFELGETEAPAINDNELLVKVKGSSVNPVDTAIRKGQLKAFVRLKLPAVLGVDVSGEVVKTGSSVTRFKTGDDVYAFMGITRNGGYGEFINIPEGYAAKTPKNISVIDAGVVPGVGLTAIEALTDIVKLQKGQKLLIVGATGGVGCFAIQIAKHLEAEVTAVCSTSNVKMAEKLGAHAVIDYKKENLFDTKERFDVILNCHRQTKNLKLKKLLNPGGVLIVNCR